MPIYLNSNFEFLTSCIIVTRRCNRGGEQEQPELADLRNSPILQGIGHQKSIMSVTSPNSKQSHKLLRSTNVRPRTRDQQKNNVITGPKTSLGGCLYVNTQGTHKISQSWRRCYLCSWGVLIISLGLGNRGGYCV